MKTLEKVAVFFGVVSLLGLVGIVAMVKPGIGIWGAFNFVVVIFVEMAIEFLTSTFAIVVVGVVLILFLLQISGQLKNIIELLKIEKKDK